MFKAILAALAAFTVMVGVSPAVAQAPGCQLMASDQTFTLRRFGVQEGMVPVNLAAGLYGQAQYQQWINPACSAERVEKELILINGWKPTDVIGLDQPFRLPVSPPAAPAQAAQPPVAPPAASAAMPNSGADIVELRNEQDKLRRLVEGFQKRNPNQSAWTPTQTAAFNTAVGRITALEGTLRSLGARVADVEAKVKTAQDTADKALAATTRPSLLRTLGLEPDDEVIGRREMEVALVALNNRIGTVAMASPSTIDPSVPWLTWDRLIPGILFIILFGLVIWLYFRTRASKEVDDAVPAPEAKPQGDASSPDAET